MTAGTKIIEGLKQAIAGDFSRVTIEGQTWVRVGAVSEAEVEAAAIAIHDSEYDATTYLWETETIATRQGYREMARAALEAALAVRRKSSP